jgi:hypothetical protein
MYWKYPPTPPGVDGERVARPRKLILSTETWNRVGCPATSVSRSSKNPSIETNVLLDGIGFLVRYLFELKCAWMGRIDSARLLL